jgi:hypothetical protein
MNGTSIPFPLCDIMAFTFRSRYIVSSVKMFLNDELVRMWKEAIVTYDEKSVNRSQIEVKQL